MSRVVAYLPPDALREVVRAYLIPGAAYSRSASSYWTFKIGVTTEDITDTIGTITTQTTALRSHTAIAFDMTSRRLLESQPVVVDYTRVGNPGSIDGTAILLVIGHAASDPYTTTKNPEIRKASETSIPYLKALGFTEDKVMVNLRDERLPETISLYGDSTSWSMDSSPGTEFPVAMRTKVDLSDFSECRIVARVASAGSSGSTMWLEYSADASNFNRLTSLTIDCGTASTQASLWEPIPPGACTDVIVRIWGQKTSASTPTINGVWLEVR